MADLSQAMRNLYRRVSNLAIWAVVTRTDDSTPAQRLQVAGRAGESFDGVTHLLPYGLMLRVVPMSAGGQGSETLVIAIDRDHRVALPAIDRRSRPTDLADGEVALYTDEDRDGDSQGLCRIHLKRDRTIEIHCDTANIEAANAVRVTATDDIRLEGKNIEIHATERLAWDCLGHGYELLPTHQVSWTGTATGEGFDINPDEIGDSRDE